MTPHYLTTEEDDSVDISGSFDGLVMASAPATNVGGGTRFIFGEENPSLNHSISVSSCHSGFPAQEGVVLRGNNYDGIVRCITVTKNIWGYATHVYNVHVWDTSMFPEPGFMIATFDMSKAPIHNGCRKLAASAQDDQLTFKVWSSNEEEPSWSDPVAVKRVRIPDDWIEEGSPMLYGGHILSERWILYGDIKTG